MAGDVLKLDEVTFRRGETKILHGINLSIGRGEHWVLIGPNGAGKSTILSFASAQVFPTSGTVDILGERMGRVELQALRRHIGHVNPRHPLRSNLSVREVVLTGLTGTIERPFRWEPGPNEIAKADDLIAEVGLTSRADAGWKVLSQGERGRALVARALIADPQLLLFDEPTTGLDVAAREQLLETIDSLSVTSPELTTLLVTHHLEEIPESTSHAMLMSHGQLTASGDIAEVLTTDQVSAAFEHPIDVGFADGRFSARAIRERALAVG
ncbi:ABC transporter ATP-binding protein [Brevibacterium sp.]|uniref:ABC transporter ATP-binding protein n=1 Tax=Brevibacterium sp. TaxID=1701 RepID=UPI00264A2C7E|nr:ATP-binding cassette domain-containing protein [Brevibacterium sp.]MDN5807069.1 ATP-binding cassette domain-containing protein [Brevibacterium sp.]MDN6158723.1 ATP-binding cassette domain-containing protein [Brevibacterium sp.]MDN6605415.1 ATP-binding cassette domain-containing protein [Brevibacterium sp.]